MSKTTQSKLNYLLISLAALADRVSSLLESMTAKKEASVFSNDTRRDEIIGNAPIDNRGSWCAP